MPYPCYLITPAPRLQVHLRRYVSSSEPKCPLPWGYHDARTLLGEYDYPAPVEGKYENYQEFEESLRPPNDDPRWPTQCACGYQFVNEVYQMSSERMMTRSDNGQLTTMRDATPGAMWYAWWYGFNDEEGRYMTWDWDNQLTPPLICKTPGGDWCIDGRASNCGKPNDRTHRCWIRHGEVPRIHVDKNGDTCSAGAGSIVSGNYHGFLHNGALTDGC